jgi:copper transport protein
MNVHVLTPTLRPEATRRVAARLAVVLVALVAVPAASAHATLVSTDPESNEIVQVSPKQVTLTFSEPVETAFGAVRVFNADADRVDKGDLTRPSGEAVAIALVDDLPNGTYTVTWRVVSADTHPVNGAFVFHVGEAGANAGINPDVIEGGTPRSVSLSYDVERFLAFAALFLAVGGSVALLVFLRDAQQPVRRKLWYLVAASSGLLALLGPVAIVLQGAAAGGFAIGDAIDRDVASEVLGTDYGHLIVVRTILAAALCVLALAAPRLSLRTRFVEEATLLPATGLVLIPALSGHAKVSGTAAFVLDVIHVAAACVWVGGLAFVVLALLLATDGRWPLAMRCVPRFSAAAVISVSALIVAGSLNGYLQVRSLDALFTTTYGQLLLVKIALVAPLLALGAFNNRFAVPRLRAGDATAVQRRRFMRMTGTELGIMLAVIGVTAVLVSEPPAKAQAGAISQPKGAVSVFAGPYHVELELDPGTAGKNDVVLTVVHGGEVTEITVSASLPSQQIGPLKYTAEKQSADTYVASGADLSIPGVWTFTVNIRKGEFDAFEGKAELPVGGSAAP